MSQIFFCCGCFAAVANSVRALGTALFLLANATINAFVKAWNRLRTFIRVARTKRWTLLILLAIVLALVGVFFVYESPDALTSVDKFNECSIRPFAETFDKFFLIPIRDIWEAFSDWWNVAIRYISCTCFTLLSLDFGDWINEKTEIVRTVDEADVDDETFSFFLTSEYWFGVGGVLSSLVEIPWFLWKFLECAFYFWSEPHPLWIYPVNTTNAVNEIPAFYPFFPFEILAPTNSPMPPLPPFQDDFTWPIVDNRTGILPDEYKDIQYPEFDNIVDYAEYLDTEGSEFGRRVYEYNPLYGAYQIFPFTATFRYFRRIIVAFWTIITEIINAFFLILRMFRKLDAEDFVEALVVDVRSSLSLWRILFDTYSRTFMAITAIMPSQIHCDNIDIPQTSRIRLMLEFMVFKTMRIVANLFRSIALFFHGVTSTRTRGIPFVDIIADLSEGTYTGINFPKIEHRFCATYEKADLTGPTTCIIWPDHFTPGCPEWDGISFASWYDVTRIRYIRSVAAAFLEFLQLPGIINRAFEIVTCDASFTIPVLRFFIVKIESVVKCILGLLDVLTSIIYILIHLVCAGFVGSPSSDLLKLVKFVFIDDLLNNVAVGCFQFFTGITCIEGQNFFTCLVTQLSVMDPTGAIEIFCIAAREVLQILDQIISTITNITDKFNIFSGDFYRNLGEVWNEPSFWESLLETFTPFVDIFTIDTKTLFGVVSVTGSGENLSAVGPQLTNPVDEPGYSLLMPCTQAEIDNLIDNLGYEAADPSNKKRSVSDFTLGNVTSVEYMEARKRMILAQHSAKRDIPKEEQNPYYGFKNKFEGTLKDDLQKLKELNESEQLGEIRRKLSNATATVLTEHAEEAKFLRGTMFASDTRKVIEAMQKCYTGEYEISFEEDGEIDYRLLSPSQYALCVDISVFQFEGGTINNNNNTETTDMSKTCLACRCLQVAHDCFDEEVASSVRTIGNTFRENIVASSWVFRIIKWFIRQLSWLVEVGSCSRASPYLRATVTKADTGIRSVFGMIFFVYGEARRVFHIGRYYLFAYEECLSRVEKKYSSTADEAWKNGSAIVIDYVHCLEEPYIAEEAWWVPRTDSNDALVVWREYLREEQNIKNVRSWCYELLYKYGITFDDMSTTSFTGEEGVYRLCGKSHAFGTRAVLETWLVSERGIEASAGKYKATRRDPFKMWTPLDGTRNMDQYIVWWKAPFSALQSAEFMRVELFTLFDQAVEFFSSHALTVYIAWFKDVTIEKFMSFANSVVEHAHVNIRALIRIVNARADVWDKLIAPEFDLSTDSGISMREKHLRMSGDHKVEVSAKIHKRMVEDLDEMYARTHGEAYISNLHTMLKTGVAKTVPFADILKQRNEPKKRVAVKREKSVSSSAEYYETFLGEDENGWEIYEINLDKRTEHHQDRVKSKGFDNARHTADAYKKNFGSPLRWAVHGAKMDGMNTILPRGSNATEIDARTKDTVQMVPIDFLSKRSEYDQNKVYVHVRVDNRADIIDSKYNKFVSGDKKKTSSSWHYSPYMHIELGKISNALKLFVNNSLNLNLARSKKQHQQQQQRTPQELSEDLSDAQFSINIIDQITGVAQQAGKAPLTHWQTLVQQGKAMKAYRIASGQAYDNEELGEKLANAVINYEPISARKFGYVISAISRIIDRRVRTKDLPPIQTMAMIIDALASDDIESLAAWMGGSVGYITGTGFVPRLAYEHYMRAVNGQRDNLILPYTGGVGYTQRTTPFFLPSYSRMIQIAYGNQVRHTNNSHSFNARRKSSQRRRYADRMYAMLARHNHLESMFHDGDEHTWHEMELIAPHLIEDLMPTRGVDVRRVKHLMHNTVHEERSEEDVSHMRFAARIVARQTADSVTWLTLLVDFWVWVFEFFYDQVREWVEDAWDAFLTILSNFGSLLVDFLLKDAINDFINSLTCVVPDDYALDGDGTYSLGCLLQLYLPERALNFIGIWPTNSSNGVINWSDDAYVLNTSLCPASCTIHGFCEENPDVGCVNEGVCFGDDDCASNSPPSCFCGLDSLSALGLRIPCDFPNEACALDKCRCNNFELFDFPCKDEGQFLPERFEPDYFCPWNESNPNYITWVEALFLRGDEICIATNFPDEDDDGTTESKQCRFLGLSEPTDLHPQCPNCEYCMREYLSCEMAGFGIDPLRVLQAYWSMLDEAWDEIWDVTNDMVVLTIWMFLLSIMNFHKLLYANCWSCCKFLFLVISISLIAYGLLVDPDTYVFPAIFMFLAHFVSYAFTLFFYSVLILRKFIFNNPDFIRDLFEDTSIDPDPLDFDLPPIFEYIADIIAEIGALTCWVPYLCPLLGFPINANTDFFLELESSFRVFEDVPPSSYEQLCSIFGIWSVIAALFLFILTALCFDIFAGIVFSLLGLAFAILGLILIIGGYSIAAFVVLGLAVGIALSNAVVRMRRRDREDINYEMDGMEEEIERLEERVGGEEIQEEPQRVQVEEEEPFLRRGNQGDDNAILVEEGRVGAVIRRRNAAAVVREEEF